MLVSLGVLSLLVVTLAALLVIQQRAFDAHIRGLLEAQQTERRDAQLERSELLTRVQHPQLIVSPHHLDTPPDAQIEQPEDDEFDLVGTISLSGGDEDLNESAPS